MGHLISVIVPVYKTEQYIVNTIRSLKNQTFADFEVVFVDDGSPDDSVSVIHQELKGASINYSIVTQENSGLGIARNTGARKSDARKHNAVAIEVSPLLPPALIPDALST